MERVPAARMAPADVMMDSIRQTTNMCPGWGHWMNAMDASELPRSFHKALITTWRLTNFLLFQENFVERLTKVSVIAVRRAGRAVSALLDFLPRLRCEHQKRVCNHTDS